MIQTTGTIIKHKWTIKPLVELSDDEAGEVACKVMQGLIKKYEVEIFDLEKQRSQIISEMEQEKCKERMIRELGFVFP